MTLLPIFIHGNWSLGGDELFPILGGAGGMCALGAKRKVPTGKPAELGRK